MFKIKSQIKTLGLVVALGLSSGTALAVPTSLYTTIDFFPESSSPLYIGGWGSSRFDLSSADCPSGCDISDVTLLVMDPSVAPRTPVNLDGLVVSVYADNGATTGSRQGEKLFSFENPAEIMGGGLVRASFSVGDGVDSSLSNSTFYWLRLDNVSHDTPFLWSYDGFRNSEYSQGAEGVNNTFFDAENIPFLFEVNGVPSAASPVPVPGAVWMMGSGLFGLLAVSRRRTNKLTPAR